MEREGQKGQERENEQSQRSHQAKTPVSNLLSRRRPGEIKAGEKPQRNCGSAGSIPEKVGEEFGDEGLQAWSPNCSGDSSRRRFIEQVKKMESRWLYLHQSTKV